MLAWIRGKSGLRGSAVRRLSLLVFLACACALLPASAQAATKTIPVKVKLTGIEVFTDDLTGVLKSKSKRCVRNREVRLTGDSTDSDQSDELGAFQFTSGNLYVPGSWVVSVERSKRFGPAGKRKRCGADSASYVYDDQGPMQISFTGSASGAGGTVTAIPEACLPVYVYLYRDNVEIANTLVDAEGNYTFGSEQFSQAGTYRVAGPATVDADSFRSGDYRYTACYGQSDPMNVSR